MTQQPCCIRRYPTKQDAGWTCRTRDQSPQLIWKTSLVQKKSPKLHLQKKKEMSYKQNLDKKFETYNSNYEGKTESQNYERSHQSVGRKITDKFKRSRKSTINI
jgi:hypothetical protein